ncbi:hypothetical protein [Halomonas casei]|uniref:hypothetical protein n=1 Tax=Halomonas casei TaxID=2742613 RepID=UPI003CEC962A
MNTILVIFFGVIALVLGLFVALLIIGALKSGAESMREAMWENPPKFMGGLLAGFAIFYLINFGVLSFIGTPENDVFRESYNLATMNGYGGYVGAGILVLGAVFVGLGLMLEKEMNKS